MMKKIELIGKEVFLAETTKKVGEIQPSRDMCIDVILNNGCHVYAYYGTTDIHGDFYNLCKTTSRCGNQCFKARTPGCRYNRANAARAGYYADVDAAVSVW